jgi:hypothetical protein
MNFKEKVQAASNVAAMNKYNQDNVYRINCYKILNFLLNPGHRLFLKRRDTY